MPIDHAFLDELTARTDIVELVSHYVSLKRQGANYFGLCPFHNEKSPSFSVSQISRSIIALVAARAAASSTSSCARKGWSFATRYSSWPTGAG